MIYIKILLFLCISLGSAYITHKVDYANVEKDRADAVTTALNKQTAVIQQQNAVTIQTQKDKDELQNRYDSAINQLRGMRESSSANSNQPSAPAISAKGLRLLEPDAEFLEQFAKECANTELERNDVIQKYNALK